MKFVGRKAAVPPLGLLTVAAMPPVEWNKKLIDENVEALQDEDLAWADYVFISAMAVQLDFTCRTIDRCQKAGVKIVAGGPLFTVIFRLLEADPDLDEQRQDISQCENIKKYRSPDLWRIYHRF